MEEKKKQKPAVIRKSVFPESREILMCCEKEYKCTFLKIITRKINNVPRAPPCWYLWVNVTKPPKCSFNNKLCAEYFKPERERSKGNRFYYAHLYPPVRFLSLASKSSHRGQRQFPSNCSPRERRRDRLSARKAWK